MDATIAEQIINEVNKRLSFLIDVGLDYLTLDRSPHRGRRDPRWADAEPRGGTGAPPARDHRYRSLGGGDGPRFGHRRP